jgi:hypothetical protein
MIDQAKNVFDSSFYLKIHDIKFYNHSGKRIQILWLQRKIS